MVATTPSAVNPSGFTGFSTGGGTVGDITLRWNPAPGAAYYLVRQGNGPLVYEGSAPTVTLKGLPVGSYYYYLLAYYGPLGAAVADVTQPAITGASVFSLPDLRATATGPGTVTVSWGLVPGAVSYDIYRRKVTSQGTAETSVKVAYHHVGGSITDTGLWNGVTYLYDVAAVFDPFRSNYPSGSVSVTVAP
jgi:hypothetical protein